MGITAAQSAKLNMGLPAVLGRIVFRAFVLARRCAVWRSRGGHARATRSTTAILVTMLLLGLVVRPAYGQVPAPTCQFILGFKTLHDLIPAEVGDCVENQAFAANGDALQHTTKGLMVWRKADNWTAFTNGYRTWINGPHGLQDRLNTQRFDWEGMTCFDVGEGVCIKTDTRFTTECRGDASTPENCGALRLILRFTTGQWLLKVAAKNGAQLRVGDLPVSALGVYRPSSKTVQVASPIMDYSSAVQAAVLVHELRHAAQDAAGQLNASGCLQDEIQAYMDQGYFWEAIWNGSLPARNPAEKELTTIAVLTNETPSALLAYGAKSCHQG